MKIQKVIACLIKVGRFTPMGRFISITGDGQEFNAQWLGSNFSNANPFFHSKKEIFRKAYFNFISFERNVFENLE